MKTKKKTAADFKAAIETLLFRTPSGPGRGFRLRPEEIKTHGKIFAKDLPKWRPSDPTGGQNLFSI